MAQVTPNNKYEGMFLLNNSKISPETGGATRPVQDLLAKHGASVVRCDVWDERKLAYPIKDQKRGTYVLAHFEAPPTNVKGLSHDLNINEDIMRALLVRHELEFPTFRTASDMAAMQPKRDPLSDPKRRGRDDMGDDDRGRWRDGPSDEEDMRD